MVSLRLFLLATSVHFSVGFMTSFLGIAKLPTSQLSYLIDSSSGEKELPELTGVLEKCELHEFILKNHKPLGCSVEESLASEPDGSRFVFVSEVAEGGNANEAGIQVGDVVAQLSGTFDEVVDVTGLGLDKIRSLVSGRPKEEPLTIRIARGSDVMERHESALVDLCILGEDAETVECINAIHAQDRDIYFTDEDVVIDCPDDTECMLDSMWETWADGLPINSGDKEQEIDEEPREEKKKVAPWASRSSGSGTWVRDPATGEMRNIDE